MKEIKTEESVKTTVLAKALYGKVRLEYHPTKGFVVSIWITRPFWISWDMFDKVHEKFAEIVKIKKPLVAIDYSSIQAKFDGCKTVDEVRSVFAHLSKESRADASVVEMGKNRKEAIEKESIPESETTIDDIPAIPVTE